MPRFAGPDLSTVLGIWAHPDDEAYLAGGLMARAVDAGHRVVCVTATRGEHGTPDPVRWPPARLAALREHELRASLAVLGIEEHEFLDLSDGTCASQDEHAQVDPSPRSSDGSRRRPSSPSTGWLHRPHRPPDHLPVGHRGASAISTATGEPPEEMIPPRKPRSHNW